MQIDPLMPSFGVKITGVDVNSLTAGQAEAILEAGNTQGIVLIPGQSLTDAQQLEFTGLFGKVRVLRLNKHRASKRPPGIVEISNVDAQGNLVMPDNPMVHFSKGNQLWHSDYSYTPQWAAQSFLYAEEAVDGGGETEFADMASACEALPEREQANLERLVATHDRFHSRIKSGYTDFTQAERDASPPGRRTLVTAHPVTGRKVICIGSHVSAIDGMTSEQTEALVGQLLAHATQPQFVYTHQWRPGDLILWDNRSTLHRGRPADPTQRRVMRRTAVHNPATQEPHHQTSLSA